jgi:hypothetical protein
MKSHLIALVVVMLFANPRVFGQRSAEQSDARTQAKQKLLQNPSPWAPKLQDGKCTVPVFGRFMDRLPHVQPVCARHDRRYAKYGGTSLSWGRTFWRVATGQKAKDSVDRANRNAVKGVWRGIKKDVEDIGKKP